MPTGSRLTDIKDPLPTREDLRLLSEWSDGPTLSLFHPTERVAVEPEINSLRLKGAVAHAEELLEQHRFRRPEAERILAPVRELLDDKDFWKHQLEGLAIFSGDGFLRYWRIPLHVRDVVFAGSAFHVKPLLPLLSGDGLFYVLALSRNAVRLLRATRFTVDEVDLSALGIPLSLSEALAFDDLQKPELQHHPTTGPGREALGKAAVPDRAGGREHAFHGHGEEPEDEKNQTLRFLQEVDKGICRFVQGTNVPLVLAGVEYLSGLYRHATDYTAIVDDFVSGNPDRVDARDLHERALPLVERHLRASRDDAAGRFDELAARGLASAQLSDVLTAAYGGRVHSIFVRSDVEVWGLFDPASGRVEVHDEHAPGDVDLLDLAARDVLVRGGDPYAALEDEMPADALVAAIYRY